MSRKAPDTAERVRPRGWPGAAFGSLTAALSGLACWFWLLPHLAAANASPRGGVSVASEIAEVSSDDITGALSTMNLPGSAIARLQARTRGCGDRLAWVTLARAGGETPQMARLRSGTYYSPRFAVSNMPVRVAIPYPAPYASGHGTLTVLGVEHDLVVTLSPAWHVLASNGTATHAVTWQPAASCARP